jgi:predicted cupin superfamily sugar epimerase
MDEAARRIIERFALTPHPEGGFYREIYRSGLAVAHPGLPEGIEARRAAGTQIYFMLTDRQISAFHRVRWSDEIWHLYAGGPLEIHTIDAVGTYSARTMTTDLAAGEPIAVVAAGDWQAARLGPGAAWAFGGCTVVPGFDFADFDMPPAARLIEAHPAHAEIIRALTHG